VRLSERFSSLSRPAIWLGPITKRIRTADSGGTSCPDSGSNHSGCGSLTYQDQESCCPRLGSSM
jgi:hypothetical protein